jgi:biopolymer transport protein ExbD
MRIPNSPHREDLRDSRSMTPMIDVVFLLLIFFVCASSGQMPESSLPSRLAAGSVETEFSKPEEKPLGQIWLFLRTGNNGITEIQLNEGGRTFNNHDEFEETLRALADAAEEIPVILDIAPTVVVADVVRVWDACLASGFLSINFAADLGSAHGSEQDVE